MPCIVLKVMHVLQHLDGRETLFRLPVSDNQVFSQVESKVVQIVDEMRAPPGPSSSSSGAAKSATA